MDIHVDERREHERYPARWHVVVYCLCRNSKADRRTAFPAVSHDVSLEGMSIQSKHNVCAGREVLLHLRIPPIAAGLDVHTLSITGRTTYTVFDSGTDTFRTGVAILHLEAEERRILAKSLSQHFGNSPFA